VFRKLLVDLAMPRNRLLFSGFRIHVNIVIGAGPHDPKRQYALANESS